MSSMIWVRCCLVVDSSAPCNLIQVWYAADKVIKLRISGWFAVHELGHEYTNCRVWCIARRDGTVVRQASDYIGCNLDSLVL